jgi:alpha-glucosidase
MRSLSLLGLKSLLIASSFFIQAQGQTSTFRAIPTVPNAAQNGATLLPNINDPKAVNAQDVCPGYIGSNVKNTANGFTATLSLAGKPCNVYGIDIPTLDLTVEYQSDDRLHVEIVPAEITSLQTSWYLIPPSKVAKPGNEGSGSHNPLKFSWSNKPTFSFTVTRKSTGEVLFSTSSHKLVFENQFIEMISALPVDYNLYGLGETIHGLRLEPGFNKTIYAADVGDPID